MKKIVLSLMLVTALSVSTKIVAQDTAVKGYCKEKKEKCEKTESKDTVKTEKNCCANKKDSDCADKKNTASTDKADKKENCALKKGVVAKNKSCGKKS